MTYVNSRFNSSTLIATLTQANQYSNCVIFTVFLKSEVLIVSFAASLQWNQLGGKSEDQILHRMVKFTVSDVK